MFHGISESRDGTWDDSEKAVRKILERNLGMPNASADSEVPIEELTVWENTREIKLGLSLSNS